MRLMEGAGRVVAARVIFTSASVILSIKAKRTAARNKSQQAGSNRETPQLFRVHLPLKQRGTQREMLKQGQRERDKEAEKSQVKRKDR